MNDDLDLASHDDDIGQEMDERERAKERGCSTCGCLFQSDESGTMCGPCVALFAAHVDAHRALLDAEQPDDEALVGALLAQCNYLVTDLCQTDYVAMLADASRDDLARTCATIDTMVNLLATARDDCAQALAHLMEDDTEGIAGMSVTRTRSMKTDWDKDGVLRAVRGTILDRWVTSRWPDNPEMMKVGVDLVDRVSKDLYNAYSVTPLVTGLKGLDINPNEFRATTRSERWSVKVKP